MAPDPILTFFERLVWRGTASANGDEKKQRAEEKSHPSDCQRQHDGTHVKNPKRASLTWECRPHNMPDQHGVSSRSLAWEIPATALSTFVTFTRLNSGR
jgi:hypothetical protein